MTSNQQPMLLSPWYLDDEIPPVAKCWPIWNETTARFTPCFLPLISAIPVIIGALILLPYPLSLLKSWRPQWTKPFITESKHVSVDADLAPARRVAIVAHSLVVVCFLGMALQIVTIFFPFRQLTAVFPTIAWAIAIGILAIERPRVAPISILVLLTGLLFSQLVILSHTKASLAARDLPLVIAPVFALCGIFTILNMPLRDPRLQRDDISPAFSAPTVKLRTPEDNLTPWQYMTVAWMEPLVQRGSGGALENDEVWDLGYEYKHSRLHNKFRTLQGSVASRLLQANGLDLVRTTTLSLLDLATKLFTPVLLQRLLVSMKDPASPNSATITYASLSLVLRLISAQSAVFILWYSRRAYERSRGEMITMLYEKTLNRKIIGAKQKSETALDDQSNAGISGTTNGISDGQEEATKAKETGPFALWHKLRAVFGSQRQKKTPEEADKKGAASMGKILNLMRNDVYEISQRFWDFPDMFTRPIGVIVAIILIWRMLGWACLLGVVALFVSQLLNVLIARLQVYYEKKRRAATDEKLQRITQFIESIRHLRWYGWQEAWLKDIFESRQKELHLRVIQIFLSTTLAFILRFGSGLFPAVSFYALTIFAGKPLRVDLIFPAIDLFNMLENDLRKLPQLITVLLNAYVAMGRVEAFMQEPDKEQADVVPEGTDDLRLEKASFAWPGVPKNVLENVTLSFPMGLTVVYGEVGAGKTALLQALLGELDKTAGEFTRPEQVVGYCAQTAWLQSMSIRDNILFSAPYQETRYRQVLEACALVPDMAEFKHGDLSNIGENGIGLSGGQKARVALARAVYSDAKVIFLDDPLSALDHQTAEFIVNKLLAGPLMQDRTTVLVTHRTELCHRLAKQWVEVSNGKTTVHEPNEEEENALGRTHTHDSAVDEEERKKKEEEQAAAIPDKFLEEEHRATGGVKRQVYWRYIKAGTLHWWSISIIVMAAFRVLDVVLTWFLKSWGEGYEEVQAEGLFDSLPPPYKNAVPWLELFFAFSVGSSILFWLTNLIMFGVGYHAAKTIFKEALDRVAHATFRFYDVTPVGRLMNRLTSDMNTVDGALSEMFTYFVWGLVGWLSCIIVFFTSTPGFVAFAAILCSGFIYHFLRFLPVSQSLRRLEMVSLSPLMSNFGALVEGLTTVRAFSAQPTFLASVIGVVDNFQKNDHFYWSLQSWLSFRFSLLSASSTLVMTLIAVYTNISPGLTAFVLVTASKFVLFTDYMCRVYGMLEMDFTSVERVVELLDLEEETKGVVEPPAFWPTYTGDIVFDDVTIRYAANLDPALLNISLRIPAGSNTAVIGRTGSGKSTLAIALLATVVPEGGTITIDGVDIATVDRQALRSRVTFLAQEPVLFPGSMRKNLDPLDEYSDAACESVLAKIAGNHEWTLSTSIEGGGKGLSQGQRQLVGLARAMLRRSPVLIMDEATASIDFETAQRIQSVLRDEMRESTVITIAHRLEAVKNADYCVVLGKGKLVKAGKASDMLKDGGEFAGMLA